MCLVQVIVVVDFADCCCLLQINCWCLPLPPWSTCTCRGLLQLSRLLNTASEQVPHSSANVKKLNLEGKTHNVTKGKTEQMLLRNMDLVMN